MKLLNEYKDQYKLYHEFGEALLEDINQKILKYERLNIQLVTGRLKDPTSLSLKVSSDSKYQTLSDVTDLVGLRVVTTYEDEIPFIIKQFEEAFKIDEKNTNSNASKSESEFGYTSFHIVISNAKIESFKSYEDRFKDLKAEIQVRTILQHAWAEISHKIDYKAKEKPDTIYKRKLFRIAALLELADQEFGTVRQEIIKSQKELVPRKVNLISDTPINIDSLQAYVMESDTCNAIDLAIANITDSVLHYNEESISQTNLNQVLNLKIETLKGLDNELNANTENIIEAYKSQNRSWIEFRKAFPETHGNASSPRGISITYLYFHLTGKFD
jgi:ppGpp synthetase/RelA/SpoT-type nucleotidyltranferase